MLAKKFRARQRARTVREAGAMKLQDPMFKAPCGSEFFARVPLRVHVEGAHPGRRKLARLADSAAGVSGSRPAAIPAGCSYLRNRNFHAPCVYNVGNLLTRITATVLNLRESALACAGRVRQLSVISPACAPCIPLAAANSSHSIGGMSPLASRHSLSNPSSGVFWS